MEGNPSLSFLLSLLDVLVDEMMFLSNRYLLGISHFLEAFSKWRALF